MTFFRLYTAVSAHIDPQVPITAEAQQNASSYTYLHLCCLSPFMQWPSRQKNNSLKHAVNHEIKYKYKDRATILQGAFISLRGVAQTVCGVSWSWTYIKKF